MNEKREKQTENGKVSKHRKIKPETTSMQPEMPLLERLSTYSASDAYPFHMPGHKRQIKMGITSFPNPFSVDITEIDGFDNLHHAEGILKESMISAASVYGADQSWYLVNGSTCGILAAISAAVKPGEKILMARNSHKSVYHAVILNQLKPIYLYPNEVSGFQVPGGIKPELVEKELSKNPDVRAVFVTSPTYEGIISDIKKIAKVAHRHGAVLIVDEAHGAHLPYGDGKYFPYGALHEGADLVIQSLHKTLPSLTQTAILHLKSKMLDAKKVEQYLSVYQSSSPSYVLIASIENCIRYMADKGTREMEKYGERLRKIREKLEELKHFQILTNKICGADEVYGYDPSKIVLFPDSMTGTRLAEILRSEYHLESEMSSKQYVILMTSFMDTDEGFSRLELAMFELDARIDKLESPEPKAGKQSKLESSELKAGKQGKLESAKPKAGKQGKFEWISEEHSNQKSDQEKDTEKFPQQVCLPWEAWHGDSVPVSLEEAEGRTARTCVTIYPPGVPMLMPGERIGKREISRISEAWSLGLTVEGICEKKEEPSKLWIEVMR